MNELERLTIVIEAQTQQVTKAVAGVNDQIKSIEKQVSTTTKKASKGFSTLGKTLVAVFSVRALLGFFNKFLEITKQTEVFKKTLATAFTPLVNILIPVFDAIIRTIAQGVAFITGLLIGLFPSLNQASNDSTNTLVSNAKKVKNAYQGFDELNVIPSQDTSSTSVPEVKSIFTQEEINKAIESGRKFADEFKEEIKLLTVAILGLTAAIAGFKIFNTIVGIGTGFGNFLLWLLGILTAAKLGWSLLVDAFKTGGATIKIGEKAISPVLIKLQEFAAWLGTNVFNMTAWTEVYIPAFTKAFSGIANVIGNVIKFFLTLKGLVVLFIAAVVGSFIYMYNKSKEFKDKVDAVIAEFGVVFMEFYDEYLKEFVEDFIQIYEDIKTALQPLFDWFAEKFDDLKVFILALIKIITDKFNEFVTFLGDLLNGIVEFFANIGLWVLQGLLFMFKNALKLLGGIIDFIAGVFTGDWERAFDGLVSVVEQILEPIIAPFRAAFNFIVDLWNNTIGKLSWKVPDWVPFIGGNTISAPKLTKWTGTIPKLADGGMLNAGQLFIAGEAGAEMVGTHKGKTTVMPLENTDFVGAIKQAVVEGMAIASQGSNGSITMNVDGMVLAKAVEKNLNKLSTLQGGLNIAL